MKLPSRITCAHQAKPGHALISHTHKTWEELAACVGGGEMIVMVTPPEPIPAVAAPIDPPTTPKAAPTAPVAASDGAPTGVRHVDARPTAKQLYVVSKSGGSWRDATTKTRGDVSTLIKYLEDPHRKGLFLLPEVAELSADEWELYPLERAWRRGELEEYWSSPYTWYDHVEGVTRPADDSRDAKAAEALPPKPVATSKSKLSKMMPLFDTIPDGYYAIDLGDGSPIKYLRIDLVTHGTKKGARKVQTIHGDMLDDAWVKWPSGKISVYKTGIEDLILAAMVDHMGAMRRYAKTIGRCCRCGKRLTDERSRHYGIGPECEKYMPGIIHLVDLENGVG